MTHFGQFEGFVSGSALIPEGQTSTPRTPLPGSCWVGVSCNLNGDMLDLVTRIILAAGTVYVVGRGIFLTGRVVTRPRRVAIWVMCGMLTPYGIFWTRLAIRNLSVGASLQFDAWLGRMAYLMILIGVFTLQSLITQTDHVEIKTADHLRNGH